jgi:hypothetical protein
MSDSDKEIVAKLNKLTLLEESSVPSLSDYKAEVKALLPLLLKRYEVCCTIIG